MDRNNVLILQFGAPWVGEACLLNIFANILRLWALVVYLAIIRVSADSRSNPLVIPQIGKNPLISSPLWRQVASFLTIWVSIDFYYFRRIQKK